MHNTANIVGGLEIGFVPKLDNSLNTNSILKNFEEGKIKFLWSLGRDDIDIFDKHSDSLLEAEKLGAALYETDLDGMRDLLRPLSKVDLQSGQRVLSRTAYKGVMNAITKYSDEFISTDLARTQGLVNVSYSQPYPKLLPSVSCVAYSHWRCLEVGNLALHKPHSCGRASSQ